MANVVKCNNCNIIIDEMLAYIQNKISVIDEDTLVRICTTSFTSEQIVISKELLFSSVCADNAKIKRKNKGKEKRDLVDIVNVFKSMEPDLFPIFVARDLERLPPILFDHLDCTKLLKDLLQLQNELKDIKSTYVTQNQLSEFRAEILSSRNDSLLPESVCKVNKNRGGWTMDSGPIGLSYMHNTSMEEQEINSKGNNGGDSTEKQFRKIVEVSGNQNASKTAESHRTDSDSSVHHVTESSLTTGQRQVAATSSDRACILQSQQSCNKLDIENERVRFGAGEGWQRVSKRRKHMKYRYSGNTGISRDNEGNFKAVEKKVPIYITKVHKATTEKDITDYVYVKTKEKILLEKITFKYEKDHNAYKFFVLENKVTLFLDSKLWPQGIIFRRFINYRARNSNGTYNVTVKDRYQS